MSVYRPLVAVGRQELGFLPGDLNEKLAPWMAAVHDNLYALFSDAGVDGARHAIDELIEVAAAGPGSARDAVPAHRCDVRFGREVVAVLAAVDEARATGRTVDLS